MMGPLLQGLVEEFIRGWGRNTASEDIADLIFHGPSF